MEFPKYLGIVILAILVVAMSAMAAQPWSVPSNCVVINKTLVSSGNKPSNQTFTVVPHIYAYGIPVGGNAMLSIQPPPSTSSTAPYIFALADISPTDSNATAKLEITLDKYVYDVYIYTLNCTISVNKTEIRKVTVAENITSVDTGRHTWNKSGNLADVIKSLSSWSVPVPIPYSNLPADYYVPAGGLGVRVNFELNFTRPTMVSGLKAGVNNTGNYGVSVPIKNDTIDLVVGDSATISGPNPFRSGSTNGLSVSATGYKYTAYGQWYYNDNIPSDVQFWGAIVPRDWGYTMKLTVPSVPAVQPVLRQLVMSVSGNTYTIYEWPSNIASLNCSTLRLLNSKLGSYSSSDMKMAISLILASVSQMYLPGYGWFKPGASICNDSNTKWYILDAYYMYTMSVQWYIRVPAINFDAPYIYIVQPAGGVIDVDVYVWGNSPLGTYIPHGVSLSSNPNEIESVYGAVINPYYWFYGPQRNPYSWIAWTAGSKTLPLEIGYPGSFVYQGVLYIWDWPAVNTDTLGLANQLNRGSFQDSVGSVWEIYKWRSLGFLYGFHEIGKENAISSQNVTNFMTSTTDPITGTGGFRENFLTPSWQPSMYNKCYVDTYVGNGTKASIVYCYNMLFAYPIDIWTASPPKTPVPYPRNGTTINNGTNTNSTIIIGGNNNGGSSVPTPIYTRIRSGGGGGGGSSSPGGFLWGLLPLTACKSLACINPSAAYWTGGFTGSMALSSMPFALAVKWLGSSSVTTTIYVYASWAKYVNASMPQKGGLVKLGTFTLEPNTWYLIVPGSAQPLPKPNPCGYTPVPPGWLVAPNEAGVFGTVLFVTPQGNATDFYYTTKAVLSYTVSTMSAPNIIQPTVLFDSAVLMQSYKPVISTPVDQFFPQPNAPMSWWPFKASEAPYGYWTATCKGGYSGYTGNLAPYQRLDISYQPGSAQLISADVVHASVSPIVNGYFKGGEGLYVTIRPNITGPLSPSAIKGYYLYFQRNGTWVLSGELRTGVYTCNFSPMKSAIDKAMKYVGFIGMIRSTFNTTIVDRMCRYTPTNDGTVTIYMPASQAWDPATMLPIWPWDSAMVVPNVRYSGSIVGSGTIVAPSVSSAKLFNYWNVS